MVLDLAEYELLQRVAKAETRTADQQAAHFVRSGLRTCAPVDLTPTAADGAPGLGSGPAGDYGQIEQMAGEAKLVDMDLVQVLVHLVLEDDRLLDRIADKLAARLGQLALDKPVDRRRRNQPDTANAN